MTINGSCFCGQVTYKIEGELRNAESCHCSMCRKMFSSQASAHALVKPEEFSWLNGELKLTNFVAQEDFKLHFCSECGSTLGGSYKDKVSWITLGCLDENPTIKIEKHIFVGSKANWEIIPEGVPQYDEWPPKNA